MSRKISGLFGLSAVSAFVLSLFAGSPVLAQDDDGADNEGGEVIIVTGTRIARPNLSLPTPVTSVDADQIDKAGAVDIADIVNEIPALALGQGRTTNNFTFAQQGINALNLRGLGTGRTLVLVDSRRYIGAALEGSSAVDISNIPSAMVERVDVITGGASAIYGADAVAGVVNFIMKDDFEGVAVASQAGVSSEGDAEEYSASITMGGNFAEGRGNATVHVSYLTRDPVLARDRNFSRAGTAFVNPADIGMAGSPFSLVAVENSTTFFDAANPVITTSGGGPIDGSFYTFDNSLGVRTFDAGPGVTGFLTVVDSELPNLGPGNDTFAIVSPEDRYHLNLNSHYDLTDSVRLFFDGQYARTESEGEFSAVGTFFFGEILQIDNPFIQDDLRTVMMNAGLTEIGVNRANAEFGNRISVNQREMARFVTGLEGTFGDDYTYQIYYQYGLSDTTNQFVNDRFDQRWFQALDVIADPVTGQPVCRDPSNGCVPANILGGPGTVSQAAIDFVRIPSHTSSVDLDQQVIAADIAGPLPGISMPAGAIEMAAGVEYREESREDEPSFVFEEGLGYFGSTTQQLDGEFDVFEVFGEVAVPLLEDASLARSLSVEGAVRFADYSTAGSNTSYKGGLLWEPTDGLLVRGTVARAVRAPNTTELFSPLIENSGFLGLVTDPCGMNLVNSGSSNRFANCQALGVADPNTFDGTITVNAVPVSSGGNPELDVEEADTFTIGFVLQSDEILPGFSLTVDYYEIEIEDYIEQTTGNDATIQNVLNGCVDASSVENIFCDLITRGTDGTITAFRGGPTNVSSFETSGIDVGASYQRPLGNGDLALSVVASHTIDRTLLVGAAGGQEAVSVNETAGELGNPEWRGTLNAIYDLNDWSFNLTQRYVGEQVLDVAEAAGTRDRPVLDDQWYTDVQVAFNVNENWSIYGGANNLFDNDAPVHPYNNPISGPQFGSGILDAIGQYFYLGARFRL